MCPDECKEDSMPSMVKKACFSRESAAVAVASNICLTFLGLTPTLSANTWSLQRPPDTGRATWPSNLSHVLEVSGCAFVLA
eukprot:7797238-Alexandrium_andersonii.AAC.1